MGIKEGKGKLGLGLGKERESKSIDVVGPIVDPSGLALFIRGLTTFLPGPSRDSNDGWGL